MMRDSQKKLVYSIVTYKRLSEIILQYITICIAVFYAQQNQFQMQVIILRACFIKRTYI